MNLGTEKSTFKAIACTVCIQIIIVTLVQSFMILDTKLIPEGESRFSNQAVNERTHTHAPHIQAHHIPNSHIFLQVQEIFSFPNMLLSPLGHVSFILYETENIQIIFYCLNMLYIIYKYILLKPLTVLQISIGFYTIF